MTRPLIVIASVAACVIVSKLLLENVFGIDLSTWATIWIEHAGTGSAIAVVALLATDLVLPVPSSFVMVLSGAAFGPLWGSALSLLGSVGGGWLGFELVRRYGRRVSGRLVDDRELRPLEQMYKRHGVAVIVISRGLPILMESMSIVAGLSQMNRATFLLASLAGTAPVVVVYAYVGSVSRHAGSLVPAVVMLTAVFAAALVWYRQSTRSFAR